MGAVHQAAAVLSGLGDEVSCQLAESPDPLGYFGLFGVLVLLFLTSAAVRGGGRRGSEGGGGEIDRVIDDEVLRGVWRDLSAALEHPIAVREWHGQLGSVIAELIEPVDPVDGELLVHGGVPAAAVLWIHQHIVESGCGDVRVVLHQQFDTADLRALCLLRPDCE